MTDANFSLLWTSDAARDMSSPADEFLVNDMNLWALVHALSIAPEYNKHIRNILINLNQNPDVIRYRQAILADLLRSEPLTQQLETILQTIVNLENYLIIPHWDKNLLQQVAWRLSELENYVECVVTLDTILQEASRDIHSEGLQALRDRIHEITQSATFANLRRELPELLPKIRAVRSVTLAVNLDDQMRPLSAVLLSANDHRYRGKTMMGRLFRRQPKDDSEEGMGQLHRARELNTGGRHNIELDDRNSPFMPPLFRELSELLDDTSRPIAQALAKYTAISTRFLISLKQDLAFYLGAVRLVQQMRAKGLPMSAPDVLPAEARTVHLEGMYNINLAMLLRKRHDQLQQVIVSNDVHFDETGRIFILTGPNQGGKTTYVQGVGLAQIMFQAGLHVPAKSAAMSPVDNIFTHFATEERPEFEAGRLGEEAQRLHRIFNQATRHSLVLLNESLASTSASESLYIAQDIVRVMRLLGTRAIFATHLHELGADVDALNDENEGDSAVQSLVSQVMVEEDETGQVIRRTYRIQVGPPVSKSYAVELAARYGISYDQLTALLRERDVLPEQPDG